MYQQLIQDISSRYNIQKQDIELAKKLFQPVFIPSNKIVEESNKTPQYLYYIVTGYMRLYYYDDKGDQVTTHINCPHGFFTSFFDFINQSKAQTNVETITDCNLLRITKPDYDILIEECLPWKNYGIEVLQKSLDYNEQRSKDLVSLSAEQRYLKLMNQQPDILLNVPLQYIASFLGIKPESLSRIRRRI